MAVAGGVLALVGGLFGGTATIAGVSSELTMDDLVSVEPMPAAIEEDWDAGWGEIERRVRDWALDLQIASRSTETVADAMEIVHDAEGWRDPANGVWLWAELTLRRTVLCWHLPSTHAARQNEVCDPVTPPVAIFVPGYSNGPPSPTDIEAVSTIYP